MASLNCGTPGCHGVKSDSKTALSKDNPLNALIEDTASFNKIKTKKGIGDKAKNLGGNILKALVVLVALPVILTGAIVYSAYSGVKKITPYSPNKDDVVSSKIRSNSQEKIKEPEIDKSQKGENTIAKDGPHVIKYKEEQQQKGNIIDNGRGG